MVRCGDGIVLGFLDLFYKQRTHKTFLGERRLLDWRHKIHSPSVFEIEVQMILQGAMCMQPGSSICNAGHPKFLSRATMHS